MEKITRQDAPVVSSGALPIILNSQRQRTVLAFHKSQKEQFSKACACHVLKSGEGLSNNGMEMEVVLV